MGFVQSATYGVRQPPPISNIYHMHIVYCLHVELVRRNSESFHVCFVYSIAILTATDGIPTLFGTAAYHSA